MILREKKGVLVLLKYQILSFLQAVNKKKERETEVLGLAMEAADSDTGNVFSDGAT